tara:strand:- start:36 stop:767 length:732 start_codon:yes stop_codon:yes gene_type:complete
MTTINTLPEDYTIADDINDIPAHKSLENVKSDFKESILPGQFHNNIEFSEIESLFYRQPTHIKKVCTIHFIIMYFEIEKLRSYLEAIKEEHGILFIHFLLNFPIEYDIISYSLECYTNPTILLQEYRENGLRPSYYGNSITCIHVAASWSNDKDVIRLLYSYGVSIWQTDKYGYYADEINVNSFYVDHLIDYYIYFEEINGLYLTKRIQNDFYEVNREIVLLSGEARPEEYNLFDWEPPELIK